MSTVATTHINVDEAGVAWIDDTRVKVIEVILDRTAYDSTPEEIHFQYPNLSMGQIHAALAYYFDHKAELDEEIQRRWKEAGELAVSISDPSLRQKLLELKNRKTYRRHRGHDTWHWCKNCSFWPASDYEEKIKVSRGELCNQCQSKEVAGSCHR